MLIGVYGGNQAILEPIAAVLVVILHFLKTEQTLDGCLEGSSSTSYRLSPAPVRFGRTPVFRG